MQNFAAYPKNKKIKSNKTVTISFLLSYRVKQKN